MPTAQRDDRFQSTDRPRDQRTPAQRDRDRILYTSAFRRLAGVTQVTVAAEKYVFHNRLTHTLEVAQIGRRLAEYLLDNQGQQFAARIGGLDPDVVEAAALAHDLGHPPFGHIAEQRLDELIKTEASTPDGFEGNPQSFRIVTKLALRYRDVPGLNLTRATLNAILKYPWFRDTSGGKRERKWGAYHSEEDEFRWARELCPEDDEKSAEAELMDWADDIAYSVHDVEDFYRAGLIPLDRLISDDTERERFLQGVFSLWESEPDLRPPFSDEELKKAFEEIVSFAQVFFPLSQPYAGTGLQRASLRSLTATLIRRYVVDGIRLREPTPDNKRRVEIDPQYETEITMLKQLTWHYVIRHPSLRAQQYGQRRIISDLFNIFHETSNSREWEIFPPRYREQLEDIGQSIDTQSTRARMRVVIDLIAGLTEQQALELHQRLMGMSLGSVIDPIIQ